MSLLDWIVLAPAAFIGRCQRKHDHWGWLVVTGSDLEEGEVGEVPGGGCVDHQCVRGGGI